MKVEVNDLQSQIADALLKYLKSKGGQSNKDDFPYYLIGQFNLKSNSNQPYRDIMYVVDMLCDEYKAVKYTDDKKYVLQLTVEGSNIEKHGLKKYQKRKEWIQWDKKPLFIILKILAFIISLILSLLGIWKFFL